MMSNFFRSVLLTSILLMVLVLSAILTVPVYADDTTPPPTETPTEVTPPTDESTPAAVDSAPAEETVAELLAQVPEETELVVVNDEGDVLPLATEEAAQALVNGDPMWCPVGVAPSTANPLCSGAFTGISNIGSGTGIGNTGDGSLAHWLDTNDPAKAGVIWIDYNYDGWNGEIDNTITLNGLDFANLDNFALTIQGGWNGVNGNPALNVATPYSTFQEALTITNWTGAITLKNLNFTLANFGGPSDQALQVVTKGAITLDKVNVVYNGTAGAGIYDGALLDNTSGTGSVTINKSSFSNNEGYGLEVNSHGAITLSNVLVNGNDAGGATLDNSNAATAKAVTITTGTNEFSNNLGGDGLNINSKGAITLKDITANDNGADGLSADNHLAGTAQAVMLSGTNVFSGNNTNGLVVNSRGTITVSNLVANNNHNGWGADLNNTSATAALPVKLTGNNEFKYNGGGLLIQSQGAITTNNVTALTDPTLFPGNNDGVRLQNDNNFASNVTMTGTNIITGNFGDGLFVTSKGSITLNNITASGNENGYGAYLDNSGSSAPMAVLLNGTNTFNNNYSGGLEIHTNGAVTLNKVTASDNSNGYGALIHNELATLPKSVTLIGFGTFNNNAFGGLYIFTKGAITLNNVTANDSNKNFISGNAADGVGVLLDNTASTAASPQNVTINGTNVFNGNFRDGLYIRTLGLILMSNLTANDNGLGPQMDDVGYGVTIDCKDRTTTLACNASTAKAVTLMGYGIFNHNWAGGLWIKSSGAITVYNITANNNLDGSGAALENSQFGSPAPLQNVTINGTNEFNGNYWDGLFISTTGAILTNNLTANDNGDFGFLSPRGLGVYIGSGFGTIKLNGTNTLKGNGKGGLEILSSGAITINKLEASGSNGTGAFIDNGSYSGTAGVTITGWAYVDDNLTGLLVVSKGAIKITNLNTKPSGVDVNNDQPGGVILENWTGTGDVTISGTNQIFNAFGEGLVIRTNGSVFLSNMIVSNNTLGGVIIDHYLNTNAHPKNVTLTGTNYFFDNGLFGLYISTDGAITLNNVDAYNNDGYGVYLDNCGYENGPNFCTNSTISAPKITLTGSNFFENNNADGLFAVSYGAISVSNIHSTVNTGNGATLNNQSGAGSLGGITLTGLNTFEGNLQKGLVVFSHGAITISNLTADLNKNDGAALNNHSVTGATGAAVTLTGVNTFTNNGTAATGSGLVILSDGQITLSNVTATGNKASGASLNNTYASLLVTKPGIKLTGVNNFNQNLSYGLNLTSFGTVDLVNITADLNGSDGLHATTSGKFTLACGSLTNNGAFGWNVTAGGLITLKGVFGVGNPSGNNPVSPSASVIIIRGCPVPATVVILPKDESNKEEHGSNKKLIYVELDEYLRD